MATTYYNGQIAVEHASGDVTVIYPLTKSSNVEVTSSTYGYNSIVNKLQNALNNLESAVNSKAPSSHGNHVPAVETANNARFLRNDNTWQTVTPANIGASDRSHQENSDIHIPAKETANNARFLRNDNTWQTVTPANIGAAPTSHGNHVPTVETANNARFLRNDNTWQTVTPANIGAAPTSHGNHVPGFKSLSSVSHSGFGSYDTYVPDMSFIAYWNGAYNASNNSNLRYCDQGRFATGATRDYTTTAGDASKLVSTDSNGYVNLNYISSNTNNDENPTVRQFIVTNGTDGYYRKANISHIKTTLAINNVDNTADANKVVASAGKLTTARNIKIDGSVTGNANFDGSGNITITTTTNHTHSYAGSSSAGGAATSANKLNTDAGSTTTPVYFSSGVPSAITTLAVANGGTGKTTGIDAANYFLNSLTTGDSDPTGNDYYIAQYSGGGSTTTTYHRRPVSKLYNYIKSAASGSWGISVTGSAGSLSGFENNNSSGKNANDVTYNAHTYYTSNGPSTTLGASTTDGAMYSQAYSSTWVAQIAQDYRNGRLFVRGKNNGTWKPWLRVIDSDQIFSASAATTSGWDTTANRSKVPDMSFMAYWNGAYSGTSSNLAYCNQGAFASGATRAYSASAGSKNTLVSTDGNGYVMLNYINSNTNNNENPTVSQFIVTNGSDNYYRKASVAHIKSALGLGSAAYTNSTAYAAASHTHNYAASDHTHTLSLAADSGSSSIALSASTKYKLTAGGKSIIFTTPADTNTDTNTTYSVATGDSNGQIKVTPSSGSAYNVSVKGLGSAAYTASTAYAAASHTHSYAASDHTHTLSLAADSGTSAINLAASTKYKLTAGGKTLIFTTPADTNTTYSNLNQFTNGPGYITGITKSMVTTALGYTPPTSDTNTTYSFGTGDSNGQIKVTPSSGNAYNVSVKGLGDRAYDSTSYLPLAGGTMTGTIITPSNDSKGIEPASNNYGRIGATDKYFYNAYVTNIYVGALKRKASDSNIGTSSEPFNHGYFSTLYEGGSTLSTKYAANSHSHSGYATITGAAFTGQVSVKHSNASSVNASFVVTREAAAGNGNAVYITQNKNAHGVAVYQNGSDGCGIYIETQNTSSCVYAKAKDDTSYGFYTTGVACARNHTTTSTKYAKTNMKNVTDEDAKKLLNANPIYFDYKESYGGQKDRVGLIAEEILEIVPQTVVIPTGYDENEVDDSKGMDQKLLSLDYSKLVPHLIKLCQVQQKEIDELKYRIDLIENK